MVNQRKYDKQYFKQYYIKNRERILKIRKKYREDNPEQRKIYYQKNIEIELERNKQWYTDHPGYYKEYNNKHTEKVKKYQKQYRENRRKTDFKYNINNIMRSAIWRSLHGNKNSRHWEDLVGYTLNELIKRLKLTMPKGYSWNDYLNGKLHIDHKIPLSVFNFAKPEHIDFKRCWALNNLQLLLAKENLIKNDHLLKPFQPSLAI